MIINKRITILSGHYGSGKTNIAVKLAVDGVLAGKSMTIADLDIVNPYFRTKDSAATFLEYGIKLISSEYAGTNLDAPALPQEMYALTDDKSITGIIDVGGDDRGALALGRLTPFLKEENNFEMLMVLNFYRPLTRTAQDAFEIMQEIELACGLKFTGLINNSNLGTITTAEDVVKTNKLAKELSSISSLPLLYITCKNGLESDITSMLYKIGDSTKVYGLELQKRPVD